MSDTGKFFYDVSQTAQVLGRETSSGDPHRQGVMAVALFAETTGTALFLALHRGLTQINVELG